MAEPVLWHGVPCDEVPTVHVIDEAIGIVVDAVAGDLARIAPEIVDDTYPGYVLLTY
jgi:hypothetical protein